MGLSWGVGGQSQQQLEIKNCNIKIFLIGDEGVGKESLQSRYTETTFGRSNHTIPPAFTTKQLLLEGNLINLQVWILHTLKGLDIAANVQRNAAALRGVEGIVLLYDITREGTLEDVGKWAEELKRLFEEREDGAVEYLVVGNKCDLSDSRAVEYMTAVKFASERGMDLMEVSAKDYTNVDELYQNLLRKILQTKPTHLI